MTVKSSRLAVLIPLVVALLVGIVTGMNLASPAALAKVASHTSGRVLTVFIRNEAPRYISNETIRHDIPEWEQAANHDFASAWGTPQVRLILTDVPPPNAISAVFVNKGNVQGALAYHTVVNGEPRIVVYAGTGAYYGYNNSVSFTHELFELLADESISETNQGWPNDQIYVVNQGYLSQAPGTIWFQEVCDPVESYWYDIRHVQISDFVTPDWFGDQSGLEETDWMGETQSPFTITPGGYAQYWDGSNWNAIFNFRHAPVRDPGGFYKGEHDTLAGHR